MVINSCSIPEKLNLNKYLPNWHYFDCYACEMPSGVVLNAETCARQFLFTWPAWVRLLFSIRVLFAKVLRLEQEENEVLKDNTNVESPVKEGENLLFFEVKENNPQEIVLVAADSHLDAGLSFLIQKKQGKLWLYASTVVQFHNKRGRFYFFFVKPFHKLIVRCQLKSIRNSYLN